MYFFKIEQSEAQNNIFKMFKLSFVKSIRNNINSIIWLELKYKIINVAIKVGL